MGSLFKFIRLSFIEKKFFINAFYLLTIYRIRLRSTPFHTLLEQVSVDTKTLKSKSPRETISATRMAHFIRIASSFIPGSTCLSNALAGQILFARNGYKTELRIGIAHNELNPFEAHAWLTLNETILIGDVQDISRFKELPLQQTPGENYEIIHGTDTKQT